ncbi:phage tail protein [Coprococcus comes]|uniref:phage tail protein n=2 Tax=Coprococcus comes TaxID=410072 RepID=UPI00321A2E57
MADGYLNFDTKINEKGFNDGISKLGKLGKSGLSIVSKAMTGTIAAVGTGAAAIIKSSLGVVANMEQQVGGVETLFKDSANTVIANANKAYKTAGMSANNYMETVTSFSASLLQSLGGDTAKAASYADRAIVDMSDNANKMGTNMRDIQNAYQGFAKQNYTMLDNLKLGYGGTQEEMKRLISDASKMTDVQKELGVTVDASSLSFGNIVNAISVVQKQMGITGTTSKEAATTIEGSVNSAKAAWENFEAGVISANNLVDTFWTAAKNILNNLGQMIPRLGKTGMDVVESLSGKIGEAVPQLKGFTDSVGKLADKLQNMSTDELMNLGKTAAVLAGAGPVISLFGSQIGNVQTAVEGFSGITTGVLSELGKLPKGFKSATKSATNFQKDFTGSLKGLGGAITGPFQVLTPKLSATVGKIGKVVSGVPGKIGGAVGKIGSAIASKIPRITSAFSLLGDTAGYLGAWGGQIGSALQGVLGTVAGFIPSFVGLMNFGAVAAVVVAGLGLVYSQFGTQIDQILLLAQTKGPEIISNFGAGITAALPGLISSGATLILGLMNAITANLPSLISVGASIIATLVSSLGAQLPQLIPAAVQMILTLVESLISNLPQLITSGLRLMEGLAQGIANAIPQVAAKAPVIIGKLASMIITNLPKIIQTGVKIITQLAVGLVQGIPALLGKIPSMISQIKNAFTSVNWGSVGMNIISGIASGISSAVGSLISAATSAASSALDAIKSKLGIHSPSRVFRDQVGKMMALGMGIGFEKNIPVGSMNAGVQKAVQSLQRSVQLTTSVNPDKTVGGIKNNPIFKDQGFDYDRFERIQRKIAKENGNKPVFLDTKRIDRPLPKGAVPQV